MAGRAHFITGHEQTQLNDSAFFFISLLYSLLPKGLTIQNVYSVDLPGYSRIRNLVLWKVVLHK